MHFQSRGFKSPRWTRNGVLSCASVASLPRSSTSDAMTTAMDVAALTTSTAAVVAQAAAACHPLPASATHPGQARPQGLPGTQAEAHPGSQEAAPRPPGSPAAAACPAGTWVGRRQGSRGAAACLPLPSSSLEAGARAGAWADRQRRASAGRAAGGRPSGAGGRGVPLEGPQSHLQKAGHSVQSRTCRLPPAPATPHAGVSAHRLTLRHDGGLATPSETPSNHDALCSEGRTLKHWRVREERRVDDHDDLGSAEEELSQRGLRSARVRDVDFLHAHVHVVLGCLYSPTKEVSRLRLDRDDEALPLVHEHDGDADDAIAAKRHLWLSGAARGAGMNAGALTRGDALTDGVSGTSEGRARLHGQERQANGLQRRDGRLCVPQRVSSPSSSTEGGNMTCIPHGLQCSNLSPPRRIPFLPQENGLR